MQRAHVSIEFLFSVATAHCSVVENHHHINRYYDHGRRIQGEKGGCGAIPTKMSAFKEAPYSFMTARELVTNLAGN